MNPRIKRFHQLFLGICILFTLVGIIMMFIGEDHQFADEGAMLALGAGALAGIPAFYFAIQVGFRKPPSVKRDSTPENRDSSS